MTAQTCTFTDMALLSELDARALHLHVSRNALVQVLLAMALEQFTEAIPERVRRAGYHSAPADQRRGNEIASLLKTCPEGMTAIQLQDTLGVTRLTLDKSLRIALSLGRITREAGKHVAGERGAPPFIYKALLDETP